MKQPLLNPQAPAPARPEENPMAPLLAALAESEAHLQARIRSGLSRQQFQAAHALRDALQACQEVVKACQTAS